jgi:hypothetical protein
MCDAGSWSARLALLRFLSEMAPARHRGQSAFGAGVSQREMDYLRRQLEKGGGSVQGWQDRDDQRDTPSSAWTAVASVLYHARVQSPHGADVSRRRVHRCLRRLDPFPSTVWKIKAAIEAKNRADPLVSRAQL